VATERDACLPFSEADHHAANMLAAIDWALVVQAAAAALTALAAGAAWRAARASRDAVRDHQVGTLIDDLNDLHERLTTVGVVLADDPVFHRFDQHRPGLGRHLAVIDMRLPHTEKLWRTSIPDVIEDTFEEELRSTHASALHEVEEALDKVHRRRSPWWHRRRSQPVPRRSNERRRSDS
jgi:hypothetical protein